MAYGLERKAKNGKGRGFASSYNVNGLAVMYKYGVELALPKLDRQRTVAIQIELRHRRPLTVICLHADANWTTPQLDKLAEPMLSMDGDLMMIGDYNCSPSEGPLAQWLLPGRVWCADQGDAGEVSTGPVKHCDFALI